MSNLKVISRKNLPTNLPIRFTILVLLVLEVYSLSTFWWGVCGTLVFIIWIVNITLIWKQDLVDIFDKEGA